MDTASLALLITDVAEQCNGLLPRQWFHVTALFVRCFHIIVTGDCGGQVLNFL